MRSIWNFYTGQNLSSETLSVASATNMKYGIESWFQYLVSGSNTPFLPDPVFSSHHCCPTSPSKDKWRGSSCLQPNVACGPHSRSRADWIRLWLISCSPQLSYIMSKAVILLVSDCTAYNICPVVIAPSRSRRRAIVIDASSYFLRINNKHQSIRPGKKYSQEQSYLGHSFFFWFNVWYMSYHKLPKSS